MFILPAPLKERASWRVAWADTLAHAPALLSFGLGSVLLGAISELIGSVGGVDAWLDSLDQVWGQDWAFDAVYSDGAGSVVMPDSAPGVILALAVLFILFVLECLTRLFIAVKEMRMVH
ncbi:MAG: hypothetical protein ACON4T_04515 [Synechococcus sp.]